MGLVVVLSAVSCARCGVGSAQQLRHGRAFFASDSRLGTMGLRVVKKRPAFVPNRPRFTTNGVCFTTNGRPFATKGRPVALNHGRVVTNARLPATNGRTFVINVGRLFEKETSSVALSLPSSTSSPPLSQSAMSEHGLGFSKFGLPRDVDQHSKPSFLSAWLPTQPRRRPCLVGMPSIRMCPWGTVGAK